jgi:hypothetical protein
MSEPGGDAGETNPASTLVKRPANLLLPAGLLNFLLFLFFPIFSWVPILDDGFFRGKVLTLARDADRTLRPILALI